MNFLKKIILFLIFLFPISNSFGAMLTEVQNEIVEDGTGATIAGIAFNEDGTKMFTNYSSDSGTYGHVNEYILSTPFDISTKTYAGNDERCQLNHGDSDTVEHYDLEFSSDGMRLFTVHSTTNKLAKHDSIFKFDLTKPYDVSTCTHSQSVSLDTDALQNGSNAGTRGLNSRDANLERNRARGFEINDDGTKVFVIYHGHSNFHASEGGGARKTRLLEYKLSTSYDLSTISLITTAGIELEDEVTNPMGIKFSANGKRLFAVDHNSTTVRVTQISLRSAYDTSSFTIDGSVNHNTVTSDSTLQPRGISFSASGLKLYIGNDKSNGGNTNDKVYEFDLLCPFNIILGKCPSITENSDRTGIAEAQIELAKRTINLSTNSALNRLKSVSYTHLTLPTILLV